MIVDINDLVGKPFTAEVSESYGPDSYSCHGLLVEVHSRFNINVPRTNIAVCACKEASDKEILKQISTNWIRVQVPCVPCGILIQSTSSGFANHIGVFLGDNKMIHVTINHAVNVAAVSDWEKKIIGYYKYVGNNNNNT